MLNLILNSSSSYPIFTGQIRELQRLELADLRSRYGSQGRQQVSSVLIVAIEEEEIIGLVKGKETSYLYNLHIVFQTL